MPVVNLMKLPQARYRANKLCDAWMVAWMCQKPNAFSS